MSLAEVIPAFTVTRAARAAERQAARLARDAFIQAEFGPLAARFEQALTAALGLHSRITITVTPAVDAVNGRSFATLDKRIVAVRSTINATPQTVTFNPGLNFREPGQYGLIACSIDFDFFPRPSPRDALARSFVEQGIQMRGTTVSSLVVLVEGTWVELVPRHLEDAFTAWWLR